MPSPIGQITVDFRTIFRELRERDELMFKLSEELRRERTSFMRPFERATPQTVTSEPTIDTRPMRGIRLR